MVKVIIESEERVQPITDVRHETIVRSWMLTLSQFKTAGIHPALVENIEHCGYSVPTPIQAYTIPAVLTGHDMIGVAQTGEF